MSPVGPKGPTFLTGLLVRLILSFRHTGDLAIW